MRTKPEWSTVVLIVSVQLILLLIAVMALFSWFISHTEQSVGQQACHDNLVIARHIKNQINETELPPSIDHAQSIIREVRMPNSGFVCLVDAKTGTVSATCQQHLDLKGTELGSVILCPIDNEKSDEKRLVESVSQNIRNSNNCGSAKIAGNEHFVSTTYVDSLDSILVLGQQRQLSIGQFAYGIYWVRRVCFISTLLIGLGCICLSLSTLNRMSERVNGENQLLEEIVSNREAEIVKTQNAVIYGLAKLAESRDNDTGEHLDRIRSYVTILADDLRTRRADIDEGFVEHLALASSLHDIGKVGIPDAILLKPGRLSREERGIMELHTLIGGECLEAIQERLGRDNIFMHLAKQVAYYHHERWDGTGYPHRLRGDEIPLVARIVAVADVYDALTSKRPYKKPLSHLESKAIILSGSGTQFDPEVVDAFLRHEAAFENVSRSQMKLSDDDVRSEFQDLCERASKC